jgi:hypothetical protein
MPKPKFYLIRGKRPTNKFYVLASPGSVPTRRSKGYSDFNDYRDLMAAGWLEPRSTGPRGGVTYWPTRKGKYHLAKARRELESKKISTFSLTA